MDVQDNKLFVTTDRVFFVHYYGENKKLFQTPLLGPGVGILDLIPLVMKSFHTEAKHPFTSLMGGRESCWGDTSAPQLFWVN